MCCFWSSTFLPPLEIACSPLLNLQPWLAALRSVKIFESRKTDYNLANLVHSISCEWSLKIRKSYKPSFRSKRKWVPVDSCKLITWFRPKRKWVESYKPRAYYRDWDLKGSESILVSPESLFHCSRYHWRLRLLIDWQKIDSEII